jgi:hypothetical protein
MERYLIYQKTHAGTHNRSGNYFIYLLIRDALTNTSVDPTTVKISITHGGNVILAPTDMTQDDTGKYKYDYAIAADAHYGKYKVKIETTNYAMVKHFTYYVLPWTANEDVRELSGISEDKSIADDTLNNLIWNAYQEALNSCFRHYSMQRPDYCRNTGTCCGCINGTNKIFYTKHRLLADYTGDEQVLGYGEDSCCTDVDGIWKDSSTIEHQCKITVDDADAGKLTITQTDGTAIPSSAKGIYLDYYVHSPAWYKEGMYDAVNYLAAHRVLLRFGELERATAADLNAAQNIKYVSPERMYIQYKKIMAQIRVPILGGVK